MLGHQNIFSNHPSPPTTEKLHTSVTQTTNLFKCSCFQYELSYFPLSICCEIHHDLFTLQSTKYVANELQTIFNNEMKNLMQRYELDVCEDKLPELSKRLLFNGMTLSEICVLLVRYEIKRNEWETNRRRQEQKVTNKRGETNHVSVFQQSYNYIAKYVYKSLTNIVDDLLNIPDHQKNTAQDKTFKLHFVRLLKEEQKYSRQFKKRNLTVKSKSYKYKSKRKKPDLFFSSVWIQPIDEYIRQSSLLSDQESDLCPPYKRQLIYQKCDSFMHTFHHDLITHNNQTQTKTTTMKKNQ